MPIGIAGRGTPYEILASNDGSPDCSLMNKQQLIETVLAELIAAQSPAALAPPKRGSFSFPPTLPVGDGHVIPATERMIEAIGSFADLLTENDPQLARSYTKKDLMKVMRRVFGETLAKIDLNDPAEFNREQVQAGVADRFYAEIDGQRIEQQFLFGCWFLAGTTSHSIRVGPVIFEDRATWLARASSEGRVSAITGRRLIRLWKGARLSKRTPSADNELEQSVLDVLANCPFACSVETRGLVATSAEQKALLAARLAQTAVALLWASPSGVLDRLGLLYDGDVRRQHYVTFGSARRWGSSSSISRMPSGPVTPTDWEETWAESGWVMTQIGEALSAYVDPAMPVTRPKLLNALFLSLWWFHEGCVERSPLMATVKFAASMDTLADGGRRPGIVRFIEARGGSPSNTAILTTGETPFELVSEIYDYARSRTMHGSNNRVGHDWSETRSRAEMLARLCLQMACSWMTDHPDSDDIKAMQKP